MMLKDKPTRLRLPTTPRSPSSPSPLSRRQCSGLVRSFLLFIAFTFAFIVIKLPFPHGAAKHSRDFGIRKQDIVISSPLAQAEPPVAVQRRLNQFQHYAVAVKTGKETSLTRVPEQLLTFLRDLDNVIFLGESPNITIGDVIVTDVCSTLYDKYPEKPENWETTLRSLHNSHQTTSKAAAGDSLIPDEGSIGWKFDAHKNLPGFQQLFLQFPQAKWFLMIDDDTYLFMHNIDILLQQYSSDDEHYFGSETMFKGCDNVQNFGDGPTFAHGGSGIVISRGAMKKLIKNIDTCIQQYRNCWAGDVRTALCLRDQGIKLKGLKHFNKEPPNAQFWFPSDPCEIPITFHHLLLPQMQRLHQAVHRVSAAKKPEENQLSTNLFPLLFQSSATYADIFAEFYGDFGLSDFEHNTNRPGSDFQNDSAVDAINCMKQCSDNARCLAWTFDNGRCWLKNSISAGHEKHGVTSGTFPSRYRCL